MIQDFSNNKQVRGRKKYIVFFVITIFIIILGLIVLIYFSRGNQISPAIEEGQIISAPELGQWSNLKTDKISFDYPPGYTAEEREKGYFVVFKDGNKELSEAGINIDARLTGANSNYEQAVEAARNNLTDRVEKDLSPGQTGTAGVIKMYGKLNEGLGQGIPTLYVFLRDKSGGAILIESSGEIINEAVFDTIVASIN